MTDSGEGPGACALREVASAIKVAPVHSPAAPHDAPTTVERLLAAARSGLVRLRPDEAYAAMRDGAALVDIRSDSQRAADGTIPGARVVARNVLEWRLDPACSHRDPELAGGDAPLVLICDEGYASSLAAASVQRFGQRRVTDVIGGFRAWRAAGLPVQGGAETGAATRAIDCSCGHRLEAADDAQLVRRARERVDRDHPELGRSDEEIRARVAADAYGSARGMTTGSAHGSIQLPRAARAGPGALGKPESSASSADRQARRPGA